MSEAMNTLTRSCTKALTIALASLVYTNGAWAQQRTLAQTKEQATKTGESEQDRLARAHSQLDANDLLVANIWGLDREEMIRAKVLLKGPRANFSVENLSPVEALGIHARDERERVKYAEKFARALQEDVQRSIAWNKTFTEVQARLFPNPIVMDFSGQQPVAVPTATADMMGVPRRLVIDPPEPPARPANSKAR